MNEREKMKHIFFRKEATLILNVVRNFRCCDEFCHDI